MPGSRARFAAPMLLMAVALPLAACETTADPVAVAVTRPGLYDLYDCPAIKVAAQRIVRRQRELEGVMARANQGFGGGVVNATAYRPEYATLRGQMSQLRSAAAARKCGFDPATVQVVRPPTSILEPRTLPPPRRRPGTAERR